MASSTLAREAQDAAPQAAPRPIRWSIENYYKMAETGMLDTDKRYELIHGIVYEAQPISPEHNYAVQTLADRLKACAGENAVVFSQGPAQFDDDSEPQPDILVLKPPAEQYRRRHPRPEDVLLIIEIANTTLQTDRSFKLELYAHAGIPEYWILNLQKNQLETYRDPDTDEGRYREAHTLDEGEAAETQGLKDCQVAWWS